MTDLVLGEREQAALRAVLTCDPTVGGVLPGEGVLRHVARLVECDGIGLALLDATGLALGTSALGRPRAGEEGLHEAGPVGLGVQQRRRTPSGGGPHQASGVAVLSLGVRNGTEHVMTLWMVRRAGDFTERDRALLVLLTPVLERLLAQRPASATSALTEQERRVLHHVAGGLSNAEIADRLVVAPSTVRKHLEHAYRKLGVTNRLAAVSALDGEHRVASTPASHVAALV
jgi:DNA-binding CsgD family transcriptional regulator